MHTPRLLAYITLSVIIHSAWSKPHALVDIGANELIGKNLSEIFDLISSRYPDTEIEIELEPVEDSVGLASPTPVITNVTVPTSTSLTSTYSALNGSEVVSYIACVLSDLPTAVYNAGRLEGALPFPSELESHNPDPLSVMPNLKSNFTSLMGEAIVLLEGGSPAEFEYALEEVNRFVNLLQEMENAPPNITNVTLPPLTPASASGGNATTPTAPVLSNATSVSNSPTTTNTTMEVSPPLTPTPTTPPASIRLASMGNDSSEAGNSSATPSSAAPTILSPSDSTSLGSEQQLEQSNPTESIAATRVKRTDGPSQPMEVGGSNEPSANGQRNTTITERIRRFNALLRSLKSGLLIMLNCSNSTE